MSPDWNRPTVSPPPRVRDMQSSISKAVGVELSYEDDENKRAAQLSKGLAGKKKSVLILDDVWDYISLQEVGIPVGVDRCTVLFTTRALAVCRQLGCQRKIEIRCLPPDESYELFKKNLGKETTLSSEVETISRLVADRCVGLPLAITIMTRNIKGVTDIHQWRNALRGHIQKKADVEIFQKLKFSYDYLKDTTLQRCFLYCPSILQPNSFGKNRLVEFLVDEGIIKRMNSRMEELDEAHTMLNFLRDVGLLEIHSNTLLLDKVVKMNEVIRSMALQIMQENNQRVMIENDMSLTDLPDDESWTEDLLRVSQKGNQIKNIPLGFSPSCSKLTTLLLSENRDLRYIGDSFFKGMPGLKILDLSFSHIESLPCSVYDLVNLTTLLLSGCRELRKIGSVEKLRALKKLDLSLSAVEEVPQDIAMLSKLTYLDLFGTEAKGLDSRMLAKLSHLQFLRLPHSPPVKGEELACLTKLETLTCTVSDVVELNNYLKGLKGREPQLYFEVGQDITFYAGFVNDLLCEDPDLVAVEEAEDSSMVCFYNCNINEADIPSYFQDITIVKCNEARSLCNFFPSKLKHLSIRECDGLEMLCQLSLAGQCILENLGFLIQGCPSIKRLFPIHVLPNLKNLQRLYVFDCLLLEEIIFEEEEEESSMAETKETPCLSRLRILMLCDLPELKRFCGGRTTCGIPVSCFSRNSNTPKLRLDGVAVCCNSLSKVQLSCFVFEKKHAVCQCFKFLNRCPSETKVKLSLADQNPVANPVSK
ncbi:probable disease resistance protein At4g27220 isoform X2 [Euphorbia lathyris]|uniref:probable disease resistance protein At4g27220 isoform X2 n=1 Tax=Euphorbia lathyris TaxID=212925 RepID=UPI003313D187